MYPKVGLEEPLDPSDPERDEKKGGLKNPPNTIQGTEELACNASPISLDTGPDDTYSGWMSSLGLCG